MDMYYLENMTYNVNLRKDLADYKNRYKQLSNAKREIDVSHRMLKKEAKKVYNEYVELRILIEITIERLRILHDSLTDKDARRSIRQEINILEKRKTLVSAY